MSYILGARVDFSEIIVEDFISCDTIGDGIVTCGWVVVKGVFTVDDNPNLPKVPKWCRCKQNSGGLDQGTSVSLGDSNDRKKIHDYAYPEPNSKFWLIFSKFMKHKVTKVAKKVLGQEFNISYPSILYNDKGVVTKIHNYHYDYPSVWLCNNQ